MRTLVSKALIFSVIICLVILTTRSMMTPEVCFTTKNHWVRPEEANDYTPVWGHTRGIRIGIHPIAGPRGLIRIFTPYLGTGENKPYNFLALEPIMKNSSKRGFSELEYSDLDQVKGKRFWSSNDSLADAPGFLTSPGVVKAIRGEETLTIFIFSEAFNNGAKVYVRVRFFKSRPFEFEITSYIQAGSAALDYLVISATMGNYARLRNLYLEDTIKSSLDLWPDYYGMGFTDHDTTFEEEMIHDRTGAAYFIAASNESDLSNATYNEGTNMHWRYEGEPATQYWRKEHPIRSLTGLVNGRYVYWASQNKIPGGISFENFELIEPFKNGSKYVFGVSPKEAKKFISQIKEPQINDCDRNELD